MKRLRFCLLISFCLAAGVFARAQTSTPLKSTEGLNGAPTQITLGHAIVALNGPWKFRVGDSPRVAGSTAPFQFAWADPNFDDSGWETVDLRPKSGAVDPISGQSGYVPGWTAKGHPGYWGYAWYRIRVRVNMRDYGRAGEKLAIDGPADVDDAYQLFANGKLLGSFGKFPASGQRPVIYARQPRMFLLPSDGAGQNTQVLAFRVWMEPNTLTYEPDAGGLKSAPLLGASGVVAARYQLAWLELVRAYAPEPILAALFLSLAILAGCLVFFDRSDPVYLWLAGVFLLTAAEVVIVALGAWTQMIGAVAGLIAIDVFLRPLILGGWLMVWWVWFRLRRPAWVPRVVLALTLLYILSDALGEELFVGLVSHPVGAAFHLVSVGVRLLFLLLLVAIAVLGIRRQGREGWIALPAMVLVGIAQFKNELTMLHVRADWFPFGVQVTLAMIAAIALVIVIFVLLLRRLLLSVRRQREMALDVKQAQEVQQVLIPQTLPQVPGLVIESEYRPAREVGGDFFQIIPDASDGSVLIVVGDVTGHGLQAGMLVALIVGAIRAEAVHSHDPLTTLNALNNRLCGRGEAHATCLALSIAANGSATLANAGHLPPYLNGKELPMEGSLPLGMIEGAEFPQMHFHLSENDRLMLMSDGVVEAQDEHGHLFGFERVHDLMQRPITAAELATAAQKFGQQDDILALRIVRVAPEVKASRPEPELATV